MILVVSKDHPWSRRKAVALGDLRSEKFVSREHGSGTRDSFRELLAKKGQAADKILNVVMELGNTEAIKEALIAGAGISILSRTSITRELADGILVELPIRGLKMTRNFYEVIHNRRPLSPVSQAFRQFVKRP